MSTAVKGLLKGLRYISEIFEADNGKEPEIQIGNPTDVKHVAHIGCDGPSSNAPTWMNEFQGSSDPGSSDVNSTSKDSFTTATESMGVAAHRGKSRHTKKQAANSSPDVEPKPRKNKNSSSDSPNNEPSRARRTKNSAAGSESPSQEPGAKKNRKKKVGSNEGNTKPSRNKNRDPSSTNNPNL